MDHRLGRTATPACHLGNPGCGGLYEDDAEALLFQAPPLRPTGHGEYVTGSEKSRQEAVGYPAQ